MKTTLKFFAGWIMLMFFQPLFAQNLMVIHQGNGTRIQLPIESIDSIRFVSLPPPVVQKIFQNNGNVLALAVSDIDSITYDLPNPQSLPQVSTQAVTALGTSSLYAQGAVLSDGGSPVTQRGFCWSLQPMPSLANNFTTNGSGTGSFGASIAPLQAGTLYYVRAYATNSSGTAYGAQLTVSTQVPSTGGNLPAVSTTPVQYTPQQGLSAICGGNVTADGGLAVTARGVCWASGTTPTLNHNFTVDGAGAGSYNSNLSNLLPNTTYFVRAYATNDAGTVYGVSYAFTTIGLPVVQTDSVFAVTGFSANVHSKITSDGGSSITARGVCWSTSPNPTIALTTKTIDGTGLGLFTSTASALDTGTIYYIRSYASNSAGTAYGNHVVFFTLNLLFVPGNGVTDVDGNLYNSIVINGQEWMEENLKVSKFRNGDSIPYKNNSTRSSQYYYYNNDTNNNAIFGKLYNLYAMDDPRGLCPSGWHVPTDREWFTLESYLDTTIKNSSTTGYLGTNIGKKLIFNSSLWLNPNSGATNASGFSALPGGGAYPGGFGGMGSFGAWYSSTIDTTETAWFRSVNGTDSIFRGLVSYPMKLSIRCLRDGLKPTLNTIVPYALNSTSIYCGGKIISNSTDIIARGVCWDTLGNPDLFSNNKTLDGAGDGKFTSHVTGLVANKKYFIKAYAITNSDTTFGNMFSFFTAHPIDIDGNIYNTITIGNKVWMTENLRVSRYKNGDLIETNLADTAWRNSTIGAFSIYDNESVNDSIFGKLYNWYAVTDPRGLCPNGWRVSTYEDFEILGLSLGGDSIAGGKLKTTGTLQNGSGLWESPNFGATNESGFSGLPGGRRTNSFQLLGSTGSWWSLKTYSSGPLYRTSLSNLTDDIYTSGGGAKSWGLSVRCVRD